MVGLGVYFIKELSGIALHFTSPLGANDGIPHQTLLCNLPLGMSRDHCKFRSPGQERPLCLSQGRPGYDDYPLIIDAFSVVNPVDVALFVIVISVVVDVVNIVVVGCISAVVVE